MSSSFYHVITLVECLKALHLAASNMDLSIMKYKFIQNSILVKKHTVHGPFLRDSANPNIYT